MTTNFYNLDSLIGPERIYAAVEKNSDHKTYHQAVQKMFVDLDCHVYSGWDLVYRLDQMSPIIVSTWLVNVENHPSVYSISTQILPTSHKDNFKKSIHTVNKLWKEKNEVLKKRTLLHGFADTDTFIGKDTLDLCLQISRYGSITVDSPTSDDLRYTSENSRHATRPDWYTIVQYLTDQNYVEKKTLEFVLSLQNLQPVTIWPEKFQIKNHNNRIEN